MTREKPHSSAPVRVTLHEDCQLVSFGLRAMLAAYPGRVTLVAFHDFLAGTDEADLLLLDPEPAPGRWVSPRIFADLGSGIVLYTWRPSMDLSQVAAIPGVVGHVSKSASAADLVSAVEALGRSRHLGDATFSELSEREGQVLALVAQGLSNEDIADKLILSGNTVKTYIRTAYAKIGAETRSQATAWTLRHYS